MNIKRINELSIQAAADSLAHGYRDNKYTAFRLLTKAAVEMAECVNAYRSGRYANKSSFDANRYTYNHIKSAINRDELCISNYRGNCSDTVQDEMADVAIYCLVAVGHFCPDGIEHDIAYKARLEKDFVCNAGFVMATLTAPTILAGLPGNPTVEECLQTVVPTILEFLERWMRRDLDQNLEYWIEQKMEYNKLRPYLHGRKTDPTI